MPGSDPLEIVQNIIFRRAGTVRTEEMSLVLFPSFPCNLFLKQVSYCY